MSSGAVFAGRSAVKSRSVGGGAGVSVRRVSASGLAGCVRAEGRLRRVGRSGCGLCTVCAVAESRPMDGGHPPVELCTVH